MIALPRYSRYVYGERCVETHVLIDKSIVKPFTSYCYFVYHHSATI